MNITITHDSPTPPYEQLRLGIIEQVRSGELVAGSKIPTVRQLAGDLGIAPNTVARAYRELEQESVLETRGRQGSFIATSGDPTRDHAGRAATDYVATIRKLGLSDADAKAFVDSALAAES